MSENDYIKIYSSLGPKNVNKLRSRYKIGLSENWSNPNSTDIKSVKNVKDVAKYFAKYMSKGEEDRRTISGKCWGASQNISSAKIESIVLDQSDQNKVLKPLENAKIKRKRITLQDKITRLEVCIGQMFLFTYDMIKSFTGTVIGDAYAKQIVIINNS